MSDYAKFAGDVGHRVIEQERNDIVAGREYCTDDEARVSVRRAREDIASLVVLLDATNVQLRSIRRWMIGLGILLLLAILAR